MATMASTRPAMVYSVATTSTRSPSSRAVVAVIGPIVTTRACAASLWAMVGPTCSTKFRTVGREGGGGGRADSRQAHRRQGARLQPERCQALPDVGHTVGASKDDPVKGGELAQRRIQRSVIVGWGHNVNHRQDNGHRPQGLE